MTVLRNPDSGPGRRGPAALAYRWLVAVLVAALTLEPCVAVAQSAGGRGARGKAGGASRSAGLGDEQGDMLLEVGRIGKAAYDAVIKSGRYVVGPGDAFVILLDNGEEPDAFEVLVGAEGKLVIPYVGSIDIAGLNLADAHAAIHGAVKQKFRLLDINVSLSRLRSFPISVIGQVQTPGAYNVEGVEQVSELVNKAGGLLDDAGAKASSRNIQILRPMPDGTVKAVDRRADLALWRLSGRIEYNPFLLDGDQVYVPTIQDSVSVSGAVNLPGNYEYVEGDRVSDLLLLGGGIKGDPVTATAELLRLRRQDNSEIRIPVDIEAALSLDAEADLMLHPDDKLYVDSRAPRVTIEGQVYFPGAYPIAPGRTALRDLIARAGGFTPEAALTQASVIRQADYSETEGGAKRLQNIPPAYLTPDQRAYLTLRTQQISGRLPVDFTALFERGDERHNVLLKEGDVVRVPRMMPAVQVNGFVRIPAAIPYDSTYTYHDYIERAGGFNDKAKQNSVIIVKASTGNWIKASQVERIDPGDEVHVPGKAPVHAWRLFRETLIVLTQVATLVIAVRSIR
jgi:protein involved in polysaccharide export with SLBB domain